MKRLLLVLLLTVSISVGMAAAQDAAPTAPTARTEYEALDLSTPEAAVTTFADAFQDGNYPRVFLVLAPEAQQGWYSGFSLFRPELLVDESMADQLFEATRDLFGFDHTETEHSPYNMPYLFDAVMQFAAENDAFVIDLRGDIDIVGTEESSVPSRENGEDRDDDTPLPAVDVIVSTSELGELRFRTVQVPSGRWRVYQVIVPGGNENLLPWAIETADDE